MEACEEGRKAGLAVRRGGWAAAPQAVRLQAWQEATIAEATSHLYKFGAEGASQRWLYIQSHATAKAIYVKSHVTCDAGTGCTASLTGGGTRRRSKQPCFAVRHHHHAARSG